MQASDVKYLDGNAGFLILTTSTGGSAILALTNISLQYDVENEEVLTFEQNRTKSYATTFDSWSISCEGFFTTLTGDTTHPASGSTYVTGGQNGAQLLETIKLKANNNKIIFQVQPNNIQKGNVILTSYSLTANAGESLKWTLEMQGTSALTKSTS